MLKLGKNGQPHQGRTPWTTRGKLMKHLEVPHQPLGCNPPCAAWRDAMNARAICAKARAIRIRAEAIDRKLQLQPLYDTVRECVAQSLAGDFNTMWVLRASYIEVTRWAGTDPMRLRLLAVVQDAIIGGAS
jgi:hypothetical protein